ncbi:J domain-containing protein [Arcobacter sp. YIC-310]|uniref:J domain-containing protein n=1 Tax=Arcobacter sp. YIC-310 TaxID=3376632 RepID=UPI003C19A822
MNNTVIYIFNRLVRLAIIFFILYLIFTNFGTFLMIIGIIFILGFIAIYNIKKKIRTSGFEFKFNGQEFSQSNNTNFNFNDFQNFANKPRYNEIEEAKNFFGFTSEPTKEEIKKRYKELARKYHPDINGGDDTKMKELNHYRDILIKTVG